MTLTIQQPTSETSRKEKECVVVQCMLGTSNDNDCYIGSGLNYNPVPCPHHISDDLIYTIFM